MSPPCCTRSSTSPPRSARRSTSSAATRRSRTRSNGCDRVALRRPVARLALSEREAPDQVAAKVLRLHDRVDHDLARQVQDVDVLGVLAPQLLDARRARL